jgi:hypothetical protein
MQVLKSLTGFFKGVKLFQLVFHLILLHIINLLAFFFFIIDFFFYIYIYHYNKLKVKRISTDIFVFLNWIKIHVKVIL